MKLLIALTLLLVLPFTVRAESVTVCAYTASVMSYVGADDSGGFAYFCDASGNFIQGVPVAVSVSPIGTPSAGTAVVVIAGVLNGITPVACVLTITGVTPGASEFGINGQGSVRLQTPSFDSGLQQNLFGWITESL